MPLPLAASGSAPAPTAPPTATDATTQPAVSALLEHAAELIDSFLSHREATGSDPNTVRCERTTLTKFCFWLATGRLPERGYRGKLVFAADQAEPGWTPVAPADADSGLVIDYRDTLFEAGASEGTRYREVLQLGHFFTWLTGSADNPVSQSKARVKYRAVPTDTSSRHDSYYTAHDVTRLLRASRHLLMTARASRDTAEKRRAWHTAEVDHLIAYLLWGTGATAAAVCALRTGDIDLARATITWRHADTGKTIAVDEAETVTQPIPAALVQVLRDYLIDVRPQLGIRDDRLLVNPCAQSKHKTCRPREVQRMTKRLAAAAGLDTDGGAHTPSRWSKSYAKAILDAPNASLITLMWLQGRRTWAGLERTYGTTKPNTSGITLDHVYPTPVTSGPGTVLSRLPVATLDAAVLPA